jgi:hypothetical protein
LVGVVGQKYMDVAPVSAGELKEDAGSEIKRYFMITLFFNGGSSSALGASAGPAHPFLSFGHSQTART